MKEHILSVWEIGYGDYIIIRNIGGTDMWAMGRFHSISDGKVHLNYTDDNLVSVNVALANEGKIYLLDI